MSPRIAGGRTLLLRRFAVQMLVDCACWALGLTTAAVLRVDFHLATLVLFGQLAILPLAAACQVLAGNLFGLYTGRWRFGSFDEAAGLAKTVAVVTVVLS